MTQSSYDNESQLEPIYDKIQQLDKKLQNLEKSSQKVIVTGGKKNFQPKPLFVSQEELINLYNYLPNTLLEYITPVNVTADTYRAKTNNKVYLEYNLNGYYWVILTESESQKDCWLVPNANRRNNFHRLQDKIKSLFIIQGNLDSYDYILQKPAKIEIFSNGLRWILIKQGCLQIGKTSPAEQLIKKIENIENNKNKEIPEIIIINSQNKISKLSNQIKEYQQKINSLENNIYKLQQTIESNLLRLNKLENLNLNQNYDNCSLLQQLKQEILLELDNKLKIIISQQNINSSQVKKEHNHQLQINSKEEKKLIKYYYYKSEKLAHYGYRVTLTIESLEDIYANRVNKIIFEKFAQSNYCIFKLKSEIYYLLPEFNFKIRTNIKSLKTIFTIKNYRDNISKQFEVIKPAHVKKIKSDKWELTKRGILEF